jgi:hypothetical protein
MLQDFHLEDKPMLSRQVLRTAAAAFLVACFAVVAAPISAPAASEFEGNWKVEDTKGQPFQINLSPDGTAKGDRAGEGLTGKWTANEKRAVITWDTGWITKIVKKGDTYQKRAYEKAPAKGKPTHTSEAQKAQ